MYRCNDCKWEFDEPHREVEIHWEVPPPNKEYFYLCPICKSDDYEEINEDDDEEDELEEE
jgi:DNA-directed RNA polymerase subunit RPC12/RpoP